MLDLTAVDRVDSTGLGVLVGALKRLRAGNGQLRLAAATVRRRPGAARHRPGQGAAAVPDVATALEL